MFTNIGLAAHDDSSEKYHMKNKQTLYDSTFTELCGIKLNADDILLDIMETV